ncbi:hypothetical protein AE1304_03560 [Aeromonas enteropelogenes]
MVFLGVLTAPQCRGKREACPQATFAVADGQDTLPADTPKYLPHFPPAD